MPRRARDSQSARRPTVPPSAQGEKKMKEQAIVDLKAEARYEQAGRRQDG